MTTSSRNPAVDSWKDETDDEKKEYVRNYYNIPDTIDDWPTISRMARIAQKKQNLEYDDQYSKTNSAVVDEYIGNQEVK